MSEEKVSPNSTDTLKAPSPSFSESSTISADGLQTNMKDDRLSVDSNSKIINADSTDLPTKTSPSVPSSRKTDIVLAPAVGGSHPIVSPSYSTPAREEGELTPGPPISPLVATSEPPLDLSGANEYTPLLDSSERTSIWRMMLRDTLTRCVVATIVILVIIGAISSVFLVLNHRYYGEDFKKMGQFTYISRKKWHARELSEFAPFQQYPIRKIMFFETGTSQCNDRINCTSAVKELERYFSDVPYNFIFAGLDLMYEGRGWKYAPAIPDYSGNDTIALAFMGNFQDYPPPKKYSAEAKYFIKSAIEKKKIDPCFKVFLYYNHPYKRFLLDAVLDIEKEVKERIRCFSHISAN